MSDYGVVVHDDAAGFLARAYEWLMRAEDRNNLVLTLALARASAETGNGDFFATVERDGEVVGCAIRTPPYKLLVTAMPVAAAPALAAAVAEVYGTIPAVLGPTPIAERVAGAWVRLRGGTSVAGMEQRIHRLDRVVHPSGVAGEARLGRAEEVDMAIRWAESFAHDAGAQFAASRESVAGWLARGALWFWAVDGTPSSMTVVSGLTPNGARVGYVYTPPDLRRRGYAEALVATVSEQVLDGGRSFCVLYTDLGNLTSNAIYRRVGYEPLEDHRDFDILPEDTS